MRRRQRQKKLYKNNSHKKKLDVFINYEIFLSGYEILLKSLLMRSLIVLNARQLHFIIAGKSYEFRFGEFDSLSV